MMASANLLVILVDGLPFWKVSPDLTPFLASMPVSGPLEPGLGFSINIYAELFAGRSPDEVGYFNKWRLRRPAEYRFPGRFTRLATRTADLSRVSHFVSRGIHKSWERITGGERLANIPFQLLHYYSPNPAREIYETSTYPTIFNLWPLVQLKAYEFPGKWGEGQKDEHTVEAALRKMETCQSLFLLLGDVDATAHMYGLGVRFDRYLQRVDSWVRKLAEAFLHRHRGQGHVIVVSDHGMASTRPDGAVSVNLEQDFGTIRYDRYVPFIEAMMLRVWVRESGLREDIEDQLRTLPGGRLLNSDEREYFGVTNPEFGDILLLLDEGLAFYPSYFGARFPKALHGYNPKLDSQKAYFGYLGPGTPVLPLRSRDVFSVCRRVADQSL